MKNMLIGLNGNLKIVCWLTVRSRYSHLMILVSLILWSMWLHWHFEDRLNPRFFFCFLFLFCQEQTIKIWLSYFLREWESAEKFSFQNQYFKISNVKTSPVFNFFEKWFYECVFDFHTQNRWLYLCSQWKSQIHTILKRRSERLKKNCVLEMLTKSLCLIIEIGKKIL